jgi:flagellar biosynthetic protein FlhB
MYLPNNNLALVGSLKSRNIRSWIYFAETEEKTEEATPHRREEAQKKGQVGKSSDLNSAIIGLAIIGTIYSLTGYIGDNISQYMYYIFSNSSIFTIDQFFSISKLSLYLCLKIMAPIFGVAIIIGLLANFLQVGFIFATETLKPKLEHINPLEGFKRIFSKRALFELAKTLLKVFIIGLVIYNQVKKEYPNILLLIDMDLISMSEYLIKVTFKVSITAAVAFLILAVIDFAYQKWQFGHSLRMSKYEIRKEMKQMEGDPLIKARIREKQRIMGMRRMIQSVPEATVVVTNPTNLAVALKYDEQLMDAPQIVAKGSG